MFRSAEKRSVGELGPKQNQGGPMLSSKNKNKKVLTNGAVSAIISLALKECAAAKGLIWGYSSAGRALEWHSRGQRFDPAYLHQTNHEANALWFVFYEKTEDSDTNTKWAGSVSEVFSAHFYYLIQVACLHDWAGTPSQRKHCRGFRNIYPSERKYLNYQTVGTTA